MPTKAPAVLKKMGGGKWLQSVSKFPICFPLAILTEQSRECCNERAMFYVFKFSLRVFTCWNFRFSSLCNSPGEPYADRYGGLVGAPAPYLDRFLGAERRAVVSQAPRSSVGLGAVVALVRPRPADRREWPSSLWV